MDAKQLFLKALELTFSYPKLDVKYNEAEDHIVIIPAKDERVLYDVTDIIKLVDTLGLTCFIDCRGDEEWYERDNAERAIPRIFVF